MREPERLATPAEVLSAAPQGVRMLNTGTAVTRALRGMAAAALLATIALLAVAPAHAFNYPPLGCGAPAAWYFNGQPIGNSSVGTFSYSPAELETVSCREIANHRLRLAGLSASATVALLVGASLVSRRTRNNATQFRYA